MSNDFLDLSTVELVSTLRAAPANGSPSSQDYNDSWTEALADLASLSGFINDIMLPMLNGLDGTIQPTVNATPSGLEGRFIYGDTTDTTTLFYDALSSSSLSLADSLRVLNGIVTTVQTAVTNITVQITSLQTQLSSTNQNDIAQALQNFAASLQNVISQTTANTQAISNIQSGTIVASQLPTPTTTTLGGIKSILPVTNEFVSYIDNTGQPFLAQPTFANLAGNISITDMNGGVGASSTTAWFGDGTWKVPAGGGSGVTLQVNGVTSGNQTIENLQQGTNITIVDNGSGTKTISATTSDNVLVNTVTLSSGQLLALAGTPITIVSAPGTGKFNQLMSLSFQYKYNSVAYTVPTNAQLGAYYVNDTGYLYSLGAAAGAGLLDQTVSKVFWVTGAGGVVVPQTTLSNSSIVVFQPAGPIATTSLGVGGSGYAVNDTGTIIGGNNAATYIVTSVSTGVVTGYTVTANGAGYVTDPGAPTSTGGSQPGSGSGLTIAITATTPTNLTSGNSSVIINATYAVINLS
jgi:hypothetical protein